MRLLERITGSDSSELDGEMGSGWERDVMSGWTGVSICTVDLHYFWQQNVTYAAGDVGSGVYFVCVSAIFVCQYWCDIQKWLFFFLPF